MWVDDNTALLSCDGPDTLVRSRTVLRPLFKDLAVVDTPATASADATFVRPPFSLPLSLSVGQELT
jgi:hypothetical protein